MKTAIWTEDLLILLMYGLDFFARPTLNKCNQSYEGWLYANGMLRRVEYLEKQKWLSRQGTHGNWVYRLTAEGRRHALGGRDLEARWDREWDGQWRQLVFDMPAKQHRRRVVLLRWLRQNDFGYLQDSVWIRPDPVREIAASLKSFSKDAASFTLLECRCAPGFSDSSLVQAAWPFDRINAGYKRHQEFVSNALQRLRRKQLHPRDLFALLKDERNLWRKASSLDPLLPRELYPADYSGKNAWKKREELLKLIGTRLVMR